MGALNPFRYGRDAASLRLFHEASSTIGAPPYDLIHAHFGPNGLRATRMRELGALKGKIVTTFYGFDVSRHMAVHGHSVCAPLFALGDLFIGISDLMRRQLIDRGCPPDHTLHLRLGIDLSRFRFRSSLLRNDEPVRILSVGRLVEKKGFETAIRAFALVANKHPSLQYRIVGSGPLRGRIERLIASLGLTERLQLLGDMSDEGVRACFDSSHIFLLALQRLSTVDSDLEPTHEARRRQFGGAANSWNVLTTRAGGGVRYLPLSDIDFEKREWVPDSGWPCSKAALDPFYERAQRVCDIGPFTYRVDDWMRQDARKWPLDDEIISTSIEQYGRASIFTHEHLAELRERANVNLLLHATVTGIEKRPGSSGVEASR